MKKLTETELATAFADAQKKAEQKFPDRILNLVKDIDASIEDIRALGVHASLDLMATPTENVFSMFRQDKDGALAAPISGILEVGNIHHHFGILRELDDKPCLKIAVSSYDIRGEGSRGTIDGSSLKSTVASEVLDCQSEDGLVAFQKFILFSAARQQRLDSVRKQNNSFIFGHNP